jgi:putative DNA methylase
MNQTRKLIEVALPLETINKASAREKSIRHGHPSTLHLWWARRPLAAARAMIFAQMVDDPSSYPDIFKTQEAQEKERQRLFRIIEDLVQWENTTNEEVLGRARAEIWQSWRAACAKNADHPHARELFDHRKLPAFHDPFAGGGSLPLEAQRLGLEAYASDLNPVAVLICKAMIEIPPKFAGKPPVNPKVRGEGTLLQIEWRGAQGLAEDLRYYGRWMRDEAERRIGDLYPKVEVTTEMAKGRPDLKAHMGQVLTVIAWLWVRTVKSPNPAFAKVDVPLASTFMLSTKTGREAYVEPVVEDVGYRFIVKVGNPKDAEAAKSGTKLARGANFQCVMSGTPITGDYIKAEGKAGRMGMRLMAMVADSGRGRLYLMPTKEAEAAARRAEPKWKPETSLAPDPRALWTPPYGLTTYGDLFTERELVALTTFADLVQEAREQVKRDAIAIGVFDDGRSLDEGGIGASAYADSIATLLGLTVSRLSNSINSLSVWSTSREQSVNLFGRQAIPMAWDFPEVNPFAGAAGDFVVSANSVARSLENCPASGSGKAEARDARNVNFEGKLVSTDPPYYDNIGYADLSDFFYVWLRRSLRPIFPDLFSTLAAPSAEELVAIPYRHGSKEAAEAFFLAGMTQAMRQLAERAHPAFPVTIYYAFKQSETEGAGIASTGWETFLDAVIRAGFCLTGTWPIRTERDQGLKTGTNVLASSIVLVCRPRAESAPVATRGEFIALLKSDIPLALTYLQRSNIAPVDLAQAAIGPGMEIYTRHARVLDAEGKPLTVREALALINQTLDEVLAKQEGDFDADTRWALAWFEQYGFAEGDYGTAETLSKAKNTSVEGMKEAGNIASGRGKVRLLKPAELSERWDPATDERLTAWEIVHHLILALDSGEQAAAELVARLGSKAEVARELAYRLYAISEHRNRSQEALSYNGLVKSWPEVARLAREINRPLTEQGALFDRG